MIIDNELKKLGFIPREESGIAGCRTIPCFQDKMPYDKDKCVPCAIIQSMCSISPYKQMGGTEQK